MSFVLNWNIVQYCICSVRMFQFSTNHCAELGHSSVVCASNTVSCCVMLYNDGVKYKFDLALHQYLNWNLWSYAGIFSKRFLSFLEVFSFHLTQTCYFLQNSHFLDTDFHSPSIYLARRLTLCSKMFSLARIVVVGERASDCLTPAHHPIRQTIPFIHNPLG